MSSHVPSLFASERLSTAEGGLGSTLNSVRFAVGYDQTRKIFIGVEQYVDAQSRYRTQIRVSADLVHWSSPTDVPLSGTKGT
ncbi:MAG: hypothetical protein AB7P49_08280 [Bdellovibrionales bacterium]